jgi:8-oxo-dGTP diphosphatase
VTYCYTTEAVIDDDNHWITVFMVAEVNANVEASNQEPEKCEGWEWMRWDEVPTPRFRPLDNILRDCGFAPPGVTTNRTTERRAPRPGIPDELKRVYS